MEVSVCPGCGERGEAGGTIVSERFDASPGCYALFSELLGREFSVRAYWPAHQLTVAAYALQHPVPDPAPGASPALTLYGMRLVLVRGQSTLEVPAALRALLASGVALPQLQPPANRGAITVRYAWQAADASQHIERVREWAQCVYDAWSPHHEAIASLP